MNPQLMTIQDDFQAYCMIGQLISANNATKEVIDQWLVAADLPLECPPSTCWVDGDMAKTIDAHNEWFQQKRVERRGTNPTRQSQELTMKLITAVEVKAKVKPTAADIVQRHLAADREAAARALTTGSSVPESERAVYNQHGANWAKTFYSDAANIDPRDKVPTPRQIERARAAERQAAMNVK